ncbi:MAG: hypothetical protein K2H64_05425 [Desulfovibrio sp.]|nr:hypothetical protein [Desulfovibrio sp.]
MRDGIALLDEALDLARKEKMALEVGSYEEAIDLAAKRGEITGMAWDLLGSADRGECKSRVGKLAELQRQLTSIAKAAQETIRERLCRSRKEKKRIQGYHMAVNQALQ